MSVKNYLIEINEYFMSEEKTKQDEIKPSDLAELQAQCQEYLNGWRRAQADYQNLKKEQEKEKMEFIKFATTGLLLEILPVYDHLKLALKHVQPAEQDKEWVKGVEHIKNQFKKVLADNGITEIKSVGEKFNPAEHEAVEEKSENRNQKSGELEENEETVKKEIKAGYKLHGKVLYPAKVII